MIRSLIWLSSHPVDPRFCHQSISSEGVRSGDTGEFAPLEASIYIYTYLDPPFGCQISAPKRSVFGGFFGGSNFRPDWRIQVYNVCIYIIQINGWKV